MSLKTDPHQYYFDVQVYWQGGHQGIIVANDVKDTVKVATPPEFKGGVPDMWSPEHLLLGALCSCLMTTCIAIAEKRQLTLTHFECSAIGHVELKEGRLVFSMIDVYPKLYVKTEAEIPLARLVLEKAGKYCIVANSLNCQIVHHGVVLTDTHPVSSNTRA